MFDFFLDSEGLDIEEPPVSFFVLDEVRNYLIHGDSSLKTHVVDYFHDVGESLLQMFACWGFSDGMLMAISGALTISD